MNYTKVAEPCIDEKVQEFIIQCSLEEAKKNDYDDTKCHVMWEVKVNGSIFFAVCDWFSEYFKWITEPYWLDYDVAKVYVSPKFGTDANPFMEGGDK